MQFLAGDKIRKVVFDFFPYPANNPSRPGPSDDNDDSDDDDGDDDDLYCVKGRSSWLPARLLLLGKRKGPDSDKKEKKHFRSAKS